MLLLTATLFLNLAPAHGQSSERPARGRRNSSEQPAPEPDQQRAARSLFDAGTIAFRQLRYEDALESFSQAYKLTNDPVLLFSIGMTYDRLYRLPEAVQAFEAYLQAMPDAPNRPAAEERIRVIREHIDEQTTANSPAAQAQPQPALTTESTQAAPPPAPPPTTDRDDARGLRVVPQWVFWVGVGATVGLGATIVWSGLDADKKNDEFRAKGLDETSKVFKEGKDAEKRTNILVGATIGTAVATAVLGIFFTDFQGKRAQTADRSKGPHWSAWLDKSASGVVMSQSF